MGNIFGSKDAKTDNIQEDENGGKFIEVTYNGIKIKQYITNKEGKTIELTAEQVVNIKDSIDNINGIDRAIIIKGVKNLEYITNNEEKGEFKFEYNGKKRTVELKEKAITAEHISYLEQQDKLLEVLGSFRHV